MAQALLVVYVAILTTVCASTVFCPPPCLCSTATVNCSHRALAAVPQHFASSIRNVNLRSNTIERLASPAWNDVPLLETLDLSDNLLSHIDAFVLRPLARLQSLNAAKNRLHVIPDGISSLTSLSRLDLRSNALSSLTPSQLRSLCVVRYADLSRNSISSCSNITITACLVEELNLTVNELTSIPAALRSFTNLRELKMSRNKVRLVSKNAFFDMKRIELIDLSRNAITSIDSLSFQDLPRLGHVKLARNRINRIDDGAFHDCPLLERINLSSNALTVTSRAIFFGLKQLSVLDLSSNEISQMDAWTETPGLRWLSLANNRLRSISSGAFRTLTSLEHLNLSSNLISSLHKTAFVGLDRIINLDLSYNDLSNWIQEHGFGAGASLPSAKKLSLRANGIRFIPARAFEGFESLEEIDLRDNAIVSISDLAFPLISLKVLRINSSSILCDCQISWFVPWFVQAALDRSAISLHCSHPTHLRGIDVFAFDSSNYTCVDNSPRPSVKSIEMSHSIVVLGDDVDFWCYVKSEVDELQVQWRVSSGAQTRILDGDISVNATGYTAHLSISSVELSDEGTYQCVAKNSYGVAYSFNKQLNVYEVPHFVSEPDDIDIIAGQNAKFVCAARGRPPPQMKWSKDGDFPAAAERRLHLRQNDDHLYLVNVTAKDQGIYTCHANNSAGHIEASATLRVFDNSFESNEHIVRSALNDRATIRCYANLVPNMQQMRWYHNGTLLKSPSDDYELHSNAQNLLIKKVRRENAGEYTCELWTSRDLLLRKVTELMVIDEAAVNFTTTSEARGSGYDAAHVALVPTAAAVG